MGLVAQRLALLGQPVRIRLIEHSDRVPELSVQALADELGATQQNVSHHLALLLDVGWVTVGGRDASCGTGRLSHPVRDV